MARDLSSPISDAIEAPVYRDVMFLSLNFDGGVERLCTAPYSIWFDDGTGTDVEFFGVGTLGSVSAIEEGSELRSYGMTFTLSGCDPAQLALSLNEKYQGRLATVWMGFVNSEWNLIGSPVLLQNMIIDTMPIELGKTGTVSVSLENILARWDTANPSNIRLTDADQQARYKGDLGLQFTANTATREILWGRS